MRSVQMSFLNLSKKDKAKEAGDNFVDVSAKNSLGLPADIWAEFNSDEAVKHRQDQREKFGLRR